MTNPRAVLCMDIDGTLIDAREVVHPADQDVLTGFPDSVQPIITTGRILHSARGVLRQNGLFVNGKFPLAGVFMNGGIACLPFEKPCLKRSFSASLRQKVIQLAIHFPHTAFTFFTAKGVHLVNATAFGQKNSPAALPRCKSHCPSGPAG
jgi:hydroxymethylpyrimidine pyrophosphatase-like HAD family hydrolase